MNDAPILICYDRSADPDHAIAAAAALLGPRRPGHPVLIVPPANRR